MPLRETAGFPGSIQEIEHFVPVDGGFVMALDLDDGGAVRIGVSRLGLWAPPPPLTEAYALTEEHPLKAWPSGFL